MVEVSSTQQGQRLHSSAPRTPWVGIHSDAEEYSCGDGDNRNMPPQRIRGEVFTFKYLEHDDGKNKCLKPSEKASAHLWTGSAHALVELCLMCFLVLFNF